MKASGKIGSNGVKVSDNVERRFETDIHTYIHTNRKYNSGRMCTGVTRGFAGVKLS